MITFRQYEAYEIVMDELPPELLHYKRLFKIDKKQRRMCDYRYIDSHLMKTSYRLNKFTNMARLSNNRNPING